ncbi:MAG: sodium:alanine symporter family protein [Clostridia bacterium]|nr:sodium:alanine symporter family protein [Clostridia bacterium]
MQNFLDAVSSVVWGVPMLIFFIFTALRFTFKSRFFQLHPIKIFKTTLGSMFKKDSNESGISQFSAFCSVLGACIGTGNIVGVATALYSGGPGTVFWMIISAFFSMMTAYSENYLGIKYSTGKVIGSFGYIENGLKMKKLAKVYAFFCLVSVLGMGNMTQSNSISDALNSSMGLSPVIVAIACASLCLLIIFGGMKRIARVQTVIVPLMCILYLVLSGIILVKYRSEILPCIKIILSEAFTLRAVSGFGIYKAARYGISRGVFSNEAGLGSSTLIHAQANNKNGETQGTWAMLEVFIDTILMCTLTAIVMLVATNYNQHNLFGAELSAEAYSAAGLVGKGGIGILTAVFAFMSLIGCSFYGEKSFEYLFGKKYIVFYRILYIALAFVGGINSPKLIWSFADICNGLMALPNLFAINCLAKEVIYPKVKKSLKTN